MSYNNIDDRREKSKLCFFINKWKKDNFDFLSIHLSEKNVIYVFYIIYIEKRQKNNEK